MAQNGVISDNSHDEMNDAMLEDVNNDMSDINQNADIKNNSDDEIQKEFLNKVTPY